MIRKNNNLSWLRTNQALGVMLALFMIGLLAYILLSSWAFRSQRDGFLLGFMPLASVCFMLLLSLAIIFDKKRRKDAREDSEAMVAATSASLIFAFILLAMMAFYFLIVILAGYLLATPIFLFLGAFGLGARPWGLVAFFSVFVSSLIFLLLTSLGVALPPGFLFE
jgi:MFS family permease